MAGGFLGWRGRRRSPTTEVGGKERTAPARSIGKTMAPNELPIRRGDDTAELRARYNQLCTALTLNAGTNAAAAERVLQELQTLAQKIAFRESDRAGPVPQATSARADDATPHGKSNVIAFRCRVKGQSRENPRLSAALSALTDDVPLVAVELAGRPNATVDAPAERHNRTSSAPVEPPMVAAVAKQGAELERLVRKSEDQTRALERLEQQLSHGEPGAQLSAEVAALRSAATRQGEQLVSL